MRDISNTSFDLGENMSEEKLARKILRSLPKRFNIKVIVIEETKDLGSIKVHELIGSLQTFEMSIIDRSEKKNKGITFVSNSKGSHSDKEESQTDIIILLGKKVQHLLEEHGHEVEDK